MSTKVSLVKAMVFPLVTYGCESWTIKKAECRRIDAFEVWCWRRLLRVPWIARRSNQSILKEISPGCSLEGLMWSWNSNTLATWWKGWLIWKDHDAGKDWGQEEKGTTEDEMAGWHHCLNGHGFGWTPGVGDGQGGLACPGSWGHRVRHDWATELNWNTSFGKWLQSFSVKQLQEIHKTSVSPASLKYHFFAESKNPPCVTSNLALGIQQLPLQWDRN